MLLTEEEIKTIILEEAIQYLEEIKGELGPEKFQQLLQKMKGTYKKGHIPFTKAHRKAHGTDIAGMKDLEVYELVVGGPGQAFKGKQREDWPLEDQDKKMIAAWFVRNYSDVNEIEDILDCTTRPTRPCKPLIKWDIVRHFVRMRFDEDPTVKQVRKQAIGLEEIITEEIIKYLKENE